MDRLRNLIARGLSEPLDSDVFERCAASLLRPLYPGLVHVPGGTDFGMDGYVAPANEPPIVLVATTSDRGPANIRRNLGAYRTSGGPSRTAIFATTQSMGGRKRRNADAAAGEEEFTLLNSFDRGWFAEELYRDPRWRLELLGIPGDSPALSYIPASRLLNVGVPLLGRVTELDDLRDVQGDVVIVGEPGVGKSAILRELAKDDWGLFVVDYSLDRLADAIREEDPRRIIVDDAHFRNDFLPRLRHLRDEIDASLDIVAVTWPGQADVVRAELQPVVTFGVELLPRDVILEVIEAVGVNGPTEFQAALVTQARGRPGLAATLALLAVRGGIREVATGEALFNETEATVRRLLGNQSASVLGVIALSGGFGGAMEGVPNVLNLDLATQREVIVGLASGGVIAEVGSPKSRLVVQPEALRYAAVRAVFFRGPGSLPLERALAQLPDPSAAVLPLAAAAHRGAAVPDGILRELVVARPTRSVVEAYASLRMTQAEVALFAAPGEGTVIGTTALRHSPRWAFRILMERAVGDNRVRHSYPDHPMRQRSDHVAAEGSRERYELFEAASAYIAEGGDPNVGLEAIAYSLSPRFERHSTDAGLGRTWTMHHGTLSLPELENAAGLWGRVPDLLPVKGCKDYQPLIGTLTDWAYPGRMGGSVDDRRSRLMQEVAARAVVDVASAMTGHAGVLTRLAELSTHAGLGAPISVARNFRTLFPPGRLEGNWQAHERRYDASARRYAARLATMEPTVVAGRLVDAETS